MQQNWTFFSKLTNFGPRHGLKPFHARLGQQLSFVRMLIMPTSKNDQGHSSLQLLATTDFRLGMLVLEWKVFSGGIWIYNNYINDHCTWLSTDGLGEYHPCSLQLWQILCAHMIRYDYLPLLLICVQSRPLQSLWSSVRVVQRWLSLIISGVTIDHSYLQIV